jgi:hypothetical protein
VIFWWLNDIVEYGGQVIGRRQRGGLKFFRSNTKKMLNQLESKEERTTHVPD